MKREKISLNRTTAEKCNKLMQKILEKRAKCKLLKDEIQEGKYRTEKLLLELQGRASREYIKHHIPKKCIK